MSHTCPIPYEDVHALTIALLRTGVVLSDLLGNLLEDLPEDAFPDENQVEVLVEMVTGTITPVAEAAGADTVQATIALLQAADERVIADLRGAVELARRGSACSSVRPRRAPRRGR